MTSDGRSTTARGRPMTDPVAQEVRVTEFRRRHRLWGVRKVPDGAGTVKYHPGLRIRQDRTQEVRRFLVDLGVSEQENDVRDVAGRRRFVIVLRVELRGQPDLPQVAQAPDLARFVSGLSKDREQDRSQYGNNGNHHKKLDQGEAFFQGAVIEHG